MRCAPSEDSDQPGHLPVWSVFTVRSMGNWGPNVSSCGHRRLWSDWADARADLSLRWAHISFCWFCHEAAHLSWSKDNPNNGTCAQWRQVSLWIGAVCNESSQDALWVAKDSKIFHVGKQGSDQTVQADLSLCWAHTSLCRFCCALAHHDCIIRVSIHSIPNRHLIIFESFALKNEKENPEFQIYPYTFYWLLYTLNYMEMNKMLNWKKENGLYWKS